MQVCKNRSYFALSRTMFNPVISKLRLTSAHAICHMLHTSIWI